MYFHLKNLGASTSTKELIKHVAKTFGTMKILSRERERGIGIVYQVHAFVDMKSAHTGEELDHHAEEQIISSIIELHLACPHLT